MDTRSRYMLIRRRWLGLVTILAFALLFVAAVAAPSSAMNRLRQSVSIAADQPAAPTPVPLPAPASDGDQILNPLPVPMTETMTDTVRMVLAIYTSVTEDAQSAQVRAIVVPNNSALIYLPAIKATQATPPIATPTPTPRPAKPADLALTIWPSPSIIVIHGQTLIYELRATNYGKGQVTRALVTLPYANQQMSVIDSRFTDPRDWVSEVAAEHVDVTFGPVAAGEERTAAIVFRVRDTLADRTVISMRANYSWDDHRNGGAWRSNWAPVVIGAGNESAPWVPVLIDPIGGFAGTTHHFYTDRFIPSEGIYTWLNTPQGVRPLELRGVADLLGRVWLDFTSTGLQSGTYQLVLYGARSKLTGVSTFSVR
jgi:hypothetical protein